MIFLILCAICVAFGWYWPALMFIALFLFAWWVSPYVDLDR